MSQLAILEQEEYSWRVGEVEKDRLLVKLEESNASIIMYSFFADSVSFLSSPCLRDGFSTKYSVPAYFWTENFQRSNGFFGWENLSNQTQSLTYNICFRFLVKQLGHDLGTNDKDYLWYNVVFFAYWAVSGKMVLLCLDAPVVLRDRLQRAITSFKSPVTIDMNWLSSTFLSQIVHLYDHSVWTLRNIVRDIERCRDGVIYERPNFPALHDVARHVIHSTETLDVAINTLNNMAEMASVVNAAMPVASHRIPQDLAFHKQILHNLRARSQALDARLRNEINLAFNLVALRDSKVNVEIGTAVQRDSAAMRTISFVTMAFLPATFVSTIFSMSFFSFSPDSRSEGQSWVVSDRIWIYWVFAGPLTAAILSLWFIREYGWKHLLDSLRHLRLGG